MITCGNRKAHDGQVAQHATVEGVRHCFADAVTFNCPWLVERTHTWGDEEYGYESDTVTEECGALAWAIEDGWECELGHQHLTYGSARQQAEERLEAMVEDMASRDGSIAARLDAGETYRQIAGV